jgi:hypothetical protein
LVVILSAAKNLRLLNVATTEHRHRPRESILVVILSAAKNLRLPNMSHR